MKSIITIYYTHALQVDLELAYHKYKWQLANEGVIGMNIHTILI